jgi:ferredoxin-NADP reductase
MALVRKHRSRVAGLRSLLPDVFSVALESQDRTFQYRPGQFLHLALDPYDPARPWPESRCFSIQTAPSQGARVLEITFATKGAFTRRMAAELSPGHEVWVKLPYGDLFEADWSQHPCVFVAGGTGVTPFLSLFLDQSFARFARASLHLGVRNPSYHVFADELAKVQKAHPGFSVEITHEESQGHIPIERVFEKNGSAAVYFLSGPAAMIRGFRQRLLALGVPAEHVRSDDWE